MVALSGPVFAQPYGNLFRAEMYSKVGPGTTFTLREYRSAILVRYGDHTRLYWDTLRLNNRHIDIATGDTVINAGYQPQRIFTDTVNSGDTWQSINTFEAVAVERHGARLVIESRGFIGVELPSQNDTFFLETSKLGIGNRDNYKLEIYLNFDPAYAQIGKIKDNYLNVEYTFSALNGSLNFPGPLDSSYVNITHAFTVDPNQSAGTLSRDTHRFQVILSKNSSFRFYFNQVHAVRHPDGEIVADWSATNEDSVRLYEVQTSSDGIVFSTVQTFQKGNQYSFRDLSIPKTKQILQIKAVMLDGTAVYTDKTTFEALLSEHFVIGPNPVRSNETLMLRFTEEQLGMTVISIVSPSGNIVFSKSIDVQGDTNIRLPRLAPGLYVVRIARQNKVSARKITVQ